MGLTILAPHRAPHWYKFQITRFALMGKARSHHCASSFKRATLRWVSLRVPICLRSIRPHWSEFTPNPPRGRDAALSLIEEHGPQGQTGRSALERLTAERKIYSFFGLHIQFEPLDFPARNALSLQKFLSHFLKRWYSGFRIYLQKAVRRWSRSRNGSEPSSGEIPGMRRSS